MRDREIEEIEAEAEARAARAAAEPYSAVELKTVLRRPHRTVEVVLAERGRLAASLSDRRNLGLLAAVLFLASVTFALPYGAVLAPEQLWRIVQLFAGSALICFPALHVFGAFLGFPGIQTRDRLVAPEIADDGLPLVDSPCPLDDKRLDLDFDQHVFDV